MTTRGTHQRLKRLESEPKFGRIEAARRLGVSVAVLERMMANREIGFRRIGRRYYFSEADIERYQADSYFQPVLPGLEALPSESGGLP